MFDKIDLLVRAITRPSLIDADMLGLDFTPEELTAAFERIGLEYIYRTSQRKAIADQSPLVIRGQCPN